MAAHVCGLGCLDMRKIKQPAKCSVSFQTDPTHDVVCVCSLWKPSGRIQKKKLMPCQFTETQSQKPRRSLRMRVLSIFLVALMCVAKSPSQMCCCGSRGSSAFVPSSAPSSSSSSCSSCDQICLSPRSKLAAMRRESRYQSLTWVRRERVVSCASLTTYLWFSASSSFPSLPPFLSFSHFRVFPQLHVSASSLAPLSETDSI